MAAIWNASTQTPVVTIDAVPKQVEIFAGDRVEIVDHCFCVTRLSGAVEGIPFSGVRGLVWYDMGHYFDSDLHHKLMALIGRA